MKRTYLLLIILFLFYFSKAEENDKTLSIVLLTAPKKRPELTKTIKDLSIALENVPKGLKVTEIVFVKGCIHGCDHKELEDAIQLMKEKFPNIKITVPTFKQKESDGIENEPWIYEHYSTLWKRAAPLSGEWTYDLFKKYMIVNFYFYEALNYVYDNTNVDYVLLSEDDQTYTKDTFQTLQQLMNYKNPKRIFSKISWCQEHWCPFKGQKRFTVDCTKEFVWGAWGVMRSRKELRMFIRWMKFSKFTESEDTLGYYLCQNFDGNVEVDHVSLHFGRLYSIPN